MLRSAAFLDRDGVINIDKGYVHSIKDFEWIEHAQEAIKYLNKKNYYVFVVTNQSGISRGLYSEKDVIDLHKHVNNELKSIGAYIDEFFYSPYHKDGIYNKEYERLAHLRKPNIGMLEQAEKKWKFSKNQSFLVGDKDSDIICAKNFGIEGFLFKSGSLLSYLKNIIEK